MFFQYKVYIFLLLILLIYFLVSLECSKKQVFSLASFQSCVIPPHKSIIDFHKL